MVASLAELHFGVLITADAGIRAERLRRLSELQRKFDALPVDDDVAASYGQLAAAVADSGQQPRSRVMDILIAATAVAGTICWPNGVDLDPDVLHGDHPSASVVQPYVVREYRLQQTG